MQKSRCKRQDLPESFPQRSWDELRGLAKAGAPDERNRAASYRAFCQGVAAEVGYRQPSAFVEVFRQTFGMTALEDRDMETRAK